MASAPLMGPDRAVSIVTTIMSPHPRDGGAHPPSPPLLPPSQPPAPPPPPAPAPQPAPQPPLASQHLPQQHRGTGGGGSSPNSGCSQDQPTLAIIWSQPHPQHQHQQQQHQHQQKQQSPQPASVRSVKRPRPVKSCSQCRRRKLRCDRSLPCSQCTRTHRECKYTADPDQANLSDGSDTDSKVGPPAPGSTGSAPGGGTLGSSGPSAAAAMGAAAAAAALAPSLQEAVHRPAKRTCLPISAPASGSRPRSHCIDGPPPPPTTPTPFSRNSEAAAAEAAAAATSTAAAAMTAMTAMTAGHPALLDDLKVRLERLEKHVLSSQSLAGTDRSSGSRTTTHLASAAPETIRGLSVKQGAQRTRFYGQGSARVMVNLFEEAREYLSENSRVEGLRETLLDLHKLHKVIMDEHRKSLAPITVFIDSIVPVQKRMADILPKRSVCDRLLACYLHTCETLYRMIHIPTFRHQYELYWAGQLHETDSWSFLPQLLCVLSIGSRFETRSRGMQSERLDGVHIPTACALVRIWLDSRRGKQLIEFGTLQTELLLMYAQRMMTPRPHDSWAQVGSIIRMAMTMGMHRDPSDFMDHNVTPFWAEMRRRLWFTLMDLDTNISMALSLPSLVRDGDFTCRPPRNLDDDDLSPDMAELPPSRPIEQPTTNQMQAYASQTLSLRMRVSHLINRIDSLQDYGEILDLGEKLDRFLEDINYLFPRQGLDSGRKSQQWRTRVTLDFHVRRPLLTLFRPFAVGVPADVPGEITRAYLRSSMAILRYLEELDPLVSHYDDIADMYHFIFKPDLIQAAFSVCFFLRTPPESMRPPRHAHAHAHDYRSGHSPVDDTFAARSSSSNGSSYYDNHYCRYDTGPSSGGSNCGGGGSGGGCGPETLSVWSPARLAATVEKTLGLLIRNVGGTDLKDIVLLAIVLFSVQAGVETDVVKALKNVLDSCMRITNTSADRLASVALHERPGGFDIVLGDDYYSRQRHQHHHHHLLYQDGEASGRTAEAGAGRGSTIMADIDLWAAWGGWVMSDCD